MIELIRTVDTSRLEAWLNSNLRSQLTPDVSKYATGRLRCWLGVEPMLFPPFNTKPAVEIEQKLLNRLAEMIGWDFDFCLTTFSGDETAKGILPHRDAGYADYEVYGLNVSGTAKLDYWNGRDSFGYAPNGVEYNPKVDPATHSLILEPGSVVHFNCKNLHAATPSLNRWSMYFWRRKLVR